MSADNGIYILETGVDHKEFRVAHLQAVENVYWDDAIGDYSDDPDVWIENARGMWWESMVFETKLDAVEAAWKMADEYPILEYGVSFVEISRDW